MSAKNNPASIDEKLAQLDELREWFRGTDFELAKAGDKYKSALNLTTEIEQDLAKLTNDIKVLEEDLN
jgi:hypothetical protein